MKIYHVDSFTDSLFQGNPAAVCILSGPRPGEELMIKIAMENNLSETAFVTMKDNTGHRHIRWFTPKCEVNLCGHATLAAAHVLFSHEGVKDEELLFNSKKGVLGVKRRGDYIVLDFPADPIVKIDFFDELDCFKAKPIECYKGTDDYMLVFESEDIIEGLECDFLKAAKLSEKEGLICTAKGRSADFVSRYFAPKIEIYEDPVTGSAHTLMAPYWAGILGKSEMTALQLSKRQGQLFCEVKGSRVFIGGKAVTYSINELLL